MKSLFQRTTVQQIGYLLVLVFMSRFVSFAQQDQSFQDLAGYFNGISSIAVVGISDKDEKAGHYVPVFLKEEGFRILGVTPSGENSIALKSLNEPIDMVLLFRRSEAVPQHLDDILSLEPLPKVVWMQQGIRNPAVAARLEAKGVKVVQDTCAMVVLRMSKNSSSD